MRTRTTVLLLSGGLTIGLAACGGEDEITEQLTEEILEQSDAGNVDIESDGGQITIEGEDGSMTIDSETGEMVIEGPDGEQTYSGGTELPEDTPDVPMVDGTVESGGRIADGETTTWTATGTVDDAEAAAEQFVADLEADGWEIGQQMTMTDPEFSAIIGATKDDLEIFVTIAGEGDQPSFSWMVTQRAAG
jgi:hypothetical protein